MKDIEIPVFILLPDTIRNSLFGRVQFFRYSIKLSANGDTFISFSCSHNFISFSCLISLASTSRTMLDIGGSHCPILLFYTCVFKVFTLSKVLLWGEDRYFIKLRKYLPSPILLKVLVV